MTSTSRARRTRRATDKTRRLDGQRIARVGGRQLRGMTYRAGVGPAPVLSVVMPIYNVEKWVGEALGSILSQSLAELEVIVVDDGSQDGSLRVVRRMARRDGRVRIVRKENGGLGAARNTGLEYVRGTYVAFADSDDIIKPGSYEAMVAMLEESGSDFVTARFERGEHGSATSPNWVKRLTRRPRTGLTILDEPEALLDITAWNKVFRRTWVEEHGLQFSEGVRYEDQVPITRAYLSSTFDILDRSVYLWRTRNDGTSITQQKASLADLKDRVLSQDRCAELVHDAPQEVRDAWFVKLIGYDLPNYVDAALTALGSDVEYAEAVRGRLEHLRGEIPDEIWGRIEFRNRLVSWAFSHGEIDLVMALRGWFQQFTNGRPIGIDGDRPVFVLPPELQHPVLEPSLLRVEEVDVLPRVSLLEAHVDGTEIVLRGSAFLQNVIDAYAQHELRLVLRGDELEHEVPLTRFTDPMLNEAANRAFEDRAGSGFEARIDAHKLAGTVPEGQQVLHLDFEHTQGAFAVVSDITGLVASGSAGGRHEVVAADRLIRLAGGAGPHGRRVAIHDDWAHTAGHRIGEDGLAELIVAGPRSNPIEDVKAGTVVHRDADAGTVTVALEPSLPFDLTATLASGAIVPVAWHEEDNVLGSAERGAYVHRGPNQVARVTRRRPAVLINRVELTGDGLVVHGRGMRSAGHRLLLQGERGEGSASEVLPDGDFSVALPITQDPWQLGEMPLPPGRYLLAMLSPDGQVQQDPHVHTAVATSVRETAPVDAVLAGQPVRIGASGSWNLIVIVHELSVEDRPALKRRLLQEAYLTDREQPRLPVVLLETFKGRIAGDSPAALALELQSREGAPEPVYSVNDRSVQVPPGIRSVVRFTPEWFELLARAEHLVTNDNWPFFFRKAPGQTYIQTWHGTPLKKIANDIVNPKGLSVLYMQTMENEASSWDHLVSPSPYCSEILPRAFGYEGELLELGYPRNDRLVAADRDEQRAQIRKRLGIADDQRVILYTPTWRDAFVKTTYLDPELVVESVPDAVVLLRGHVNTSRGASLAPSAAGRIRDVTLYPDINELFLASDVLVTDYSSVMFDFALLDRPQLFLVPDLVEYRDELRGFYVDFEDVAPGPLFDDNDALIAHLNSGPAADEAYADARRAFREKFAPWDDGAASARMVDAMLGQGPISLTGSE